MTYTLTGLLIQPALPDRAAVEQLLGCTLTEAGEVLLEDVFWTQQDHGYAYIYTSAIGTMVLCGPAFYEQPDKARILSNNGAVTVFGVSAVALAYYFREYKAGVLIEVDAFETEDESRRVGSFLLDLQEHADMAYTMLDSYLFRYVGLSFQTLPPGAQITRYQVSPIQDL